MDPQTAPDPGQDGFCHCALIHQSREQYLRGVLGFAEKGLADGGRVIVAAPPQQLEAITARLNGHGDALELLDIYQLGRNPAWIIPALQRRIESHRGRRVYVMCEPLWPGRSPEEIEEVILHEALCNTAFATHALSWLCPFDATALDSDVIEEARRAHHVVATNGEKQANPDFSHEVFRERLEKPLPPLPVGGHRMSFTSSLLGALRTLVAEQAQAANLAPARSADLVFAVNELATNSIRHGGGSGELELWITPQRMIAEVRDRGRIADPLVGRINPGQNLFEGLGLWLVNQMCDLVQVRSGAGGTTVRVHLERGHSAVTAQPVG
jgi:anti-sigma regulatory factor (Ser/Thr protein kinase)